MPALTVKSVAKVLSSYVRPDEDVVGKLNFVMPRLYAMGMWRDLMFDWSINTDNKYFSLPEDAESLLGVLMNDSPVEAQNRWHDYRIGGYASEGPAPVFGVVDDGWHPTKEDLVTTTAADVYKFDLLPVSPNTVLPSEGEIVVVYTRDDDSVVEETFTLAGAASMTSANSDITEVNSITFNDLHEKVNVVATNMNDSLTTTLAQVIGDGVARYRRYRFENSAAQTRNVKLLLKRAWQPVREDEDIIYLGNVNAIKHGLLGMLAEDNADLERAQYHWTICKQLLSEELDAARGSAKPKLRLKPDSGMSATPNLM